MNKESGNEIFRGKVRSKKMLMWNDGDVWNKQIDTIFENNSIFF